MANATTKATGRAAGPMQRARKGLLLFFLLLFPVVLNFLSPYLSLSGAMEGSVSGSSVSACPNSVIRYRFGAGR